MRPGAPPKHEGPPAGGPSCPASFARVRRRGGRPGARRARGRRRSPAGEPSPGRRARIPSGPPSTTRSRQIRASGTSSPSIASTSGIAPAPATRRPSLASIRNGATAVAISTSFIPFPRAVGTMPIRSATDLPLRVPLNSAAGSARSKPLRMLRSSSSPSSWVRTSERRPAAGSSAPPRARPTRARAGIGDLGGAAVHLRGGRALPWSGVLGACAEQLEHVDLLSIRCGRSLTQGQGRAPWGYPPSVAESRRSARPAEWPRRARAAAGRALDCQVATERLDPVDEAAQAAALGVGAADAVVRDLD